MFFARSQAVRASSSQLERDLREVMERIDQVYASPVLADGKIYYTTRGGKTFVVAAKPQYELLATNDFGERSTFNASPANNKRGIIS